MAKIFATCPVTGKLIDTSIEVDEESFRRLPSVIGKVFCPHCGTEHGWTKDSARAIEGDPPNT